MELKMIPTADGWAGEVTGPLGGRTTVRKIWSGAVALGLWGRKPDTGRGMLLKLPGQEEVKSYTFPELSKEIEQLQAASGS